MSRCQICDDAPEEVITARYQLMPVFACARCAAEPDATRRELDELRAEVERLRAERAPVDEDARARRETILQTLSAVMPLGMLLDDIATELDVPEDRATVESDLAALETAGLVCAHRDGGWTVPVDLDDMAWGAGIRLLAASTIGDQR